jgi:hypothetical protein
MSRKKPDRGIKVPREVAVRRSITKDHQNKYHENSKLPHTAWKTLIQK